MVVREAHVGYLTWEAYEAHLAQLAANSQAYTPHRLHPPREGPALLQGLVLCGRCGERMTVRYHQRGGQRIVPDYLCQRAGIARGAPPCQRVPGRDLDRAIANVLVEVVTPETIAVTLAVQDDLGARAAEAARLRQLQVERAQYEADLAQRRYLRVDPENRLVADVLEAEWNAKLRALAEAREAAEQQHHQDQIRLSATEREAMLELPRAFARFWHDPRTPPRERKRVVRLLIEDVTVQKADHHPGTDPLQRRRHAHAHRALAAPVHAVAVDPTRHPRGDRSLVGHLDGCRGRRPTERASVSHLRGAALPGHACLPAPPRARLEGPVDPSAGRGHADGGGGRSAPGRERTDRVALVSPWLDYRGAL